MSKLNRVAIINKDKCKPHKCNFECGLVCPVNKQGKECIKLEDIEDVGVKKKIAVISEGNCTGCTLCTKTRGCPFDAIMIVNIPTELNADIVNRYGKNGFRLYRMPVLRQGQILGILGQNGIGKSTIVSILSNKLKPNFENFELNLTNDSIIKMFRGSEMHKYMTNLYENKYKVSNKVQHVDALINFLKSKGLNTTVGEYLDKKNEYDKTDLWYLNVISTLELDKIMDSCIISLSGGELQSLVCAGVLLSKADVYIFDEPTNFLDVRQRLNVSNLIKSLQTQKNYIIVIEHDLAILDYLSDYICIMYGKPSAYGVVSKPMSTSNAINVYFDGYIPAENMRFRANEYDIISLHYSESTDIKFTNKLLTYDQSIITYPNFELCIESGTFSAEGAINIVLGKNGTGKTSFINHIAKTLESSVSHKPQYLSVEQFKDSFGKYPTVNEFLLKNIKSSLLSEMFKSDVYKPLDIDAIKDRKLNELSGGEIQKFWIVYALGKEAHIYLLDEPSACLDIEQRVIITKVIKRFLIHNKKVGFIVEHDMMMAVSFGCEPNTQAIIMEDNFSDGDTRKFKANSPTKFSSGINKFLQMLNITFHTQTYSKHNRPRINKLNSQKDKEQKSKGNYYE
jgi:ATP-binding cassette subfamily E protein 1